MKIVHLLVSLKIDDSVFDVDHIIQEMDYNFSLPDERGSVEDFIIDTEIKDYTIL